MVFVRRGAVQLLSNMEKNNICLPDVFSYTIVVDGLCKDGLDLDALDLFSKMKRRGIVLDVVIYTTLIHGLCTIGGGI